MRVNDEVTTVVHLKVVIIACRSQCLLYRHGCSRYLSASTTVAPTSFGTASLTPPLLPPLQWKRTKGNRGMLSITFCIFVQTEIKCMLCLYLSM